MKSYSTPTTLIIIALAVIGSASASLGGTPFALIGGAIGALWGWGLVALAKRITRSKHRLQTWGNSILFVTVLFMVLVAGASLMAQLLSTAALNSQPQFFTDMIRGSIGVAEALPFYLFNTPLEWFLMPMAVLLNWGNPRTRKILITALLIWVFHRAWTYVYFVPQITDWSKGTSPLTADQLAHARTWVNLSWIRHIFDDVTAILVLVAVFIRNKSTEK
jgi:hypothetical protein